MAGEYTITLSDGVTTFTIFPNEENGPGNVSTPRQIAETNLTGGAGVNYFSLAGNLTTRFVPGFTFTVTNSAGTLNDGVFTVAPAGSTYPSMHTLIPVVELIADNSLPLGDIRYSVPLEDTSLLMSGKGSPNYGLNFHHSMVHMLENFAHTVQPVNSIAGQLWYDTNTNVLKAYDGAAYSTVNTSNTVGYNHTEAGPGAVVWNINHNLGTEFINVTTFIDVAGTLKQSLPLEVSITDANNIVVTFTAAQFGQVTIVGVV